MKVSDVMTDTVMTCRPCDTLADTAVIMRDMNVGSCPVVDDDEKLVGVITDRDITVRAISQGLNPQEVFIRDFMTPAPITVDADMNVEDAAERMMIHQVRRLPVVDEQGVVVGIVSLGDLAVDVGEVEMIAEALEQISEPSHSAR